MKITIEGTEQEIKSILSTIGISQEDKKQISVKLGDGFINPQNVGAAGTTTQGVKDLSENILKCTTKELQSELKKRIGITTLKIDYGSSAMIVTDGVSKEIQGPAIITINID